MAAEIDALLLRPSCPRPSAALLLRLTVSTSGRVVAIELLRGDPRSLPCFERALLRLVTATQAQGAANGMVELRLAGQPAPRRQREVEGTPAPGSSQRGRTATSSTSKTRVELGLIGPTAR